MIESGLLKREEVKSRTNKTHQSYWLANLPNQQQKIFDFVILTRIAFAPQSDQDRENDFLSRRTITRRQCAVLPFTTRLCADHCGPIGLSRGFPWFSPTCHTMIYMTRPQCHASECPGCEAKKMATRTQSRHLMTASKLPALVISSQSTVVFVRILVLRSEAIYVLRSDVLVYDAALFGEAGRCLWCFTLRVLSICKLCQRNSL